MGQESKKTRLVTVEVFEAMCEALNRLEPGSDSQLRMVLSVAALFGLPVYTPKTKREETEYGL
jgi:hypothetical protein